MADCSLICPNISPSKPVGYGMLARMYLYMGDYQKALDNARSFVGEQLFVIDCVSIVSIRNEDTSPSRFASGIGRQPENIYIRKMPYVYGVNASYMVPRIYCLSTTRRTTSVSCSILQEDWAM